MLPIRDNMESRILPVVTWTIIGLNLIVFVWDRGPALLASNVAFADLGLTPSHLVAAIKGQGDPLEFGKAFTSIFLHANLWHLLVNLIFLQAFGPTIERTLGGLRFALYYLFWGLVGSACHVLVNWNSSAMLLGASGAIGGVLGCYLMLFPTNRIRTVIIPVVWWPFNVNSAVLLVIWLLWQVLFPQEGVANWAHAGGFLAGMVTVMVLGGREKALRDLKPKFLEDPAGA